MTANDDTPTEGQDSIDWEAIGTDAFVMLLDHHRREVSDPVHRIRQDVQEGREPDEADLRALAKSVEGFHAVVESTIAENVLEREPYRW